MPPSRPRPTPWCGLGSLLLLIATGWLAYLQANLPIDATNATMQAQTSDDAHWSAVLAAEFGGARTTLQCFLGAPEAEPLPAELAALDRLREQLAAMPEVAAVSPRNTVADGVTLLAVDLADDDVTTTETVTARCREACPVTMRHLATGMPWIGAAIARAVARERSVMVPAIGGVLLLLLWCCYRHPAPAVAVLLPALLAILWTGGLFALLGHRLDPIAVLLEPVLLTVGVATSVHYVQSFRRARGHGHGPATACARASRALRAPALLTTLTTMLGFWSLAGNAIPAVVDFGVFAALGTALANGMTFWLLPRWLSRFPGPVPAAAPANATPPATSLFHFVARHRLAIALTTVVLGLLAGVAWCSLRVDNDPLHVLPEDHPFLRQHGELAARLGGAETFTLLVTPESKAQDPALMLPLTASLIAEPPAAGLAGPPRRSKQGSVAIPVLLAPSGSAARLPLFDQVEARATALGLTGVHAAGVSVQMARDSWRLVRTQMFGLLGTLAALGVCIALGTRSWQLGLLGLIPQVLPCLLLYGGLGLCGLPMTVASAMIGSVMLGLIVDSTIHLLHHYRLQRRTAPRALATRLALAQVTTPVTVAGAVLAFGFLTGLAGQMRTTIEFSLLAAITIALSLLATMLVLPAILLLRAPTDLATAEDSR